MQTEGNTNKQCGTSNSKPKNPVLVADTSDPAEKQVSSLRRSFRTHQCLHRESSRDLAVECATCSSTCSLWTWHGQLPSHAVRVVYTHCVSGAYCLSMYPGVTVESAHVQAVLIIYTDCCAVTRLSPIAGAAAGSLLPGIVLGNHTNASASSRARGRRRTCVAVFF